MDDLIEEISKFLGPRWVLLVARLKFFPPNGRFKIESTYAHLKDKQPVLYQRMCCMDCISQWLSSGKNQHLSEREKKQNLLTEMYSIVDFRGFVKELADAEGIALPVEAGVDETESAVVRSKPPPMVAESSPDSRIDVTTTTTRSIAYYEAPHQGQDTLAVATSSQSISSPAGESFMSYGDSYPSREAASVAAHDVGRPQVYVTPTPNGARRDHHVSRQHGQWSEDVRFPSASPRGSFDGMQAFPEESSIGSSSGTQGSSSLSTGAIGDGESSTSHYTTSEGEFSDGGGLDTLTEQSVRYSVPIDISDKKHKFAILDVSQRLSSTRWKELGDKFGMERAFIEKLSKEEEIDERFYAIIMKWLEDGGGHRTFKDLREIIKDEENALLALDERLEEEEEGQEVLVNSIRHDLLIT